MTTPQRRHTSTHAISPRRAARSAAPAGLALGLAAPTSDNGWLALGGVLLAVIGVAMAVTEWTRRHPSGQESPDEPQPDEDGS